MIRLVVWPLVVASSIVLSAEAGEHEKNVGVQKAVAARPPEVLLLDYQQRTKDEQSGAVAPVQEIVWKAVDINKDGSTDWFLYSGRFCGSAGCTGNLYVCRNKYEPCHGSDYCYVGTGHEAIFEAVRHNLRCRQDYYEIE